MNNIVAEVVRELVDATVCEEERVRNEAHRNDEEGPKVTHSQVQETRDEQFGGASLKILKVWKETPPGAYANHFNFIKLDVHLPQSITTGVNGPEEFGKMVVDLVKRYAPENATNDTRVGVTFDSPEFETGTAVGLSITPIDKVSSEKIVQTMELLTQSNRSPLEVQSSKLQVTLKFITPPSGSGKKRKEFGMEQLLESNLFDKRRRLEEDEEENEVMDVADFLDDAAEGSEEEEDSDFELDVDGEILEGRSPKSNIMKNDVNYDCLPHALLQAAMYHQAYHGETLADRKKGMALYKQSIKSYDPTRPNHGAELFRVVRKLKEEAGIQRTYDFGYEDIQRFQETVYAGKLQIIVIVEHQATPYFAGPYIGEKKTIALFLRNHQGDGHFAGVRKLPALLKTKFYCCLCLTRCGSFTTHYNCPLLHKPCGALDCPTSPDDAPLCCIKCTAVFRSKVCLENHLRKGNRAQKNRCDHSKLCKKCGEIYYTNKSKVAAKHDCGKKWCYRCNCKRPEKHHCIMSKSVKNEKKLTWKRFVYDFESMADEETGEQTPVLFVAIHYCKSCSSDIPTNLQDASESVCEHCSPEGRCKVIECVTDDNRFVNVADEAAEWMFSKEHRGFVGIAHNASGFDAQFILQSLISGTKASPSVVMAGTKIICLKHRGVKLIDSLKYLTMSLAAVGKAFRIPTEKGDFPVKFIRREHFDYVGDVPEDKWYNLEYKPTTARQKLTDFLKEERARGKQFDFVKELFKYCYSDVLILATALVTFEKDFEAATNVCLFEETTTAASAAMKVFQRQHITTTKPIVLDARPSASKKTSIVSQKYMAWFAETDNVFVSSSATTGERKIGNYHVDGFVDPIPKYPKGLVIEFHGCYWHACVCKYTDQSIIGGITGEEIRKRDAERKRFLEERHEVKIVWECKMEKQKSKNPKMAKFFEEYEPVRLMEMEKALTGGRTEVFRLMGNNNRGVIKHVDVVSMYPAVMKSEEFPIGPPRSFSLENIQTPISSTTGIQWKGFIACRVLPPRNLKLPLLAMKPNGKLMFALCWTCAKDQLQQACTHTDEERSFTGTFTTVEMKKALELGYVVTKVFDAIRYKHWAKNNADDHGGLFTTYMNQMIALKIYASGWPSDVQTNEEKKKFVEEYKKQGIILDDWSLFVESPGRRLAAKLLLNSLWGKMAQRSDMPNTTFCSNPAQFWKLFHDTSVVIEDVCVFKGVVMVQHRCRAEALKSLSTGAMHIAAHVPSYGRLHLYRLMEKVGPKNICYTDTDSVIYIVPHGKTDPLADEMGPFLGQCTSELSGKVTKFVTTGAKSYCYKEVLANGEEKITIKSKGISLNSEAAKRVTMEEMENLVDEVIDERSVRSVVEVPQQQVRRNRDHSVFFKEVQKRFRYTFDKRRVLPDGSTLPYGFC